jgi:hypothetical protein
VPSFVRRGLQAARFESDVLGSVRFAKLLELTSRRPHVVDQFHQGRGQKAVQEAGAGNKLPMRSNPSGQTVRIPLLT